MTFAWTQAAIDLLFKLHIQEGCSAAQTARALGGTATRNAVLGKVQRMGWSQAREVQPPAAAPPTPAVSMKPKLQVSRARPCTRPGPRLGPGKPLPRLREAPVVGEPKLWTERRAYECAFPIGEPTSPALQLSCCARTGGMSPYCPAHRALMRLPESQMTEQEQASIVDIARRAA